MSRSIVRMSTSVFLFLCLLVISHSHFKVVMAETDPPTIAPTTPTPTTPAPTTPTPTTPAPTTPAPATPAPTTPAPTTPAPTTPAPTTPAPTTAAPTTAAPTSSSSTGSIPNITISSSSSSFNKTVNTPIINNDKSDGVSFSTVALIILIPIGCFLVLCYCYSKRGSQTTQTAASSTFGRPTRSGPRHTRYEDLDLELGNGMVNDPDEETQDGTRTTTHDPHRGAAPATRPQFTLSAFSDNEQDLADTDIDYAGGGAVAVEEPAPKKKKKKVVKKRVETNDNDDEEETTKPVQTSSVIPTLEPPPEAPKKKKKKTRSTPTPSPNQAIEDDEA